MQYDTGRIDTGKYVTARSIDRTTERARRIYVLGTYASLWPPGRIHARPCNAVRRLRRHVLSIDRSENATYMLRGF